MDHLVLDRYGRETELAAIEEIEAAYHVDRIKDEDLTRARALLTRYADLTTFDLSDASCVVLAERHGCFDILTTDQRDFRAVGGRDGQHFRILPYDLQCNPAAKQSLRKRNIELQINCEM